MRVPSSDSLDLTYIMRPILLAKKSADKSTPTSTPKARLWVATTTKTVAIITILVETGCFFRLIIEVQEKVPIETMIITATKAAIGICFNQSPKKTINTKSKAPAVKVDNRPRPPDFTLITD